jgi:8-oxo-dGTP pyrophosphatase MutT (NUDIX family)
MIFWTASLAIVRDGRLLVVRKRGTSRFMLPGGKIEPDESALDCALREAREEVGLSVDAGHVVELGHWQAPAANEPDAVVDSVVHVTDHVPGAPSPLAEIEELAWLPLDAAGDDLAPLLLAHVLPALRARVDVGVSGGAVREAGPGG